MASKVKMLKASRGHVRKQISTYHNQVTNIAFLSQMSVLKKTQTLNTVKGLLLKIEDFNEKITVLIWDETVDDNEALFEVELDNINSYSEKISEIITILELSISNSTASSSIPSGSNPSSSSTVTTKLKAPTAPLPAFSGKEGESLEKFLYQFDNIISKYNYSDYEQLLLLGGQISGRAKALVDSLELHKQSYVEATKLLTLAFASPLTQRFEAVQRLVNLKLPYGKDPYIFIAELRSIEESIKTLKIDIDVVIQFFAWTAMNDVMQTQFVQICNSNKPSLTEIKDNIFSATERYLIQVKKYNLKKNNSPSYQGNSSYAGTKKTNIPLSSQTTTSLASDIQGATSTSNSFPAPSCILCKDDNKQFDHPVYKCEQYKGPKEKLDKLNSINACARCCRVNHVTADCKFKFKSKCRQCQSWHFRFLCLNDKPSSALETSSHVTWNQMLFHQCNSKGNSIVPTFT